MQEHITLIMELAGTVAFAVSGALVGIHQKMDLFGVIVLGVVTSVGGGVIRDLVLGEIPPSMFQNKIYALTAVITSIAVFLILYIHQTAFEGSIRRMGDRLMLAMDSIGLGIFTAVGVNAGFTHGFGDNTFLLVFVGTITGVGGGLLRDMMAGVPPYIFVRHIYACASIAGAFVCVWLYRPCGQVTAMMTACLTVTVIRGLAAHFRWDLPRVPIE
ncbi:MAG: TRIC cation channel family protein [Eubacteriales bacterium]|nr:TRIC cation channel family protein [Eubacteriales bacterium]